jgi:hypothetical protein
MLRVMQTMDRYKGRLHDGVPTVVLRDCNLILLLKPRCVFLQRNTHARQWRAQAQGFPFSEIRHRGMRPTDGSLYS